MNDDVTFALNNQLKDTSLATEEQKTFKQADYCVFLRFYD